MATNTPNFSWPIPEDSDLVKDGAKAIRDLGNAIDTSAENFGGGLIHIETVTFTSANAVSLPQDTFSANFRNYEIHVNGRFSALGQVRVRKLGTSANASNYVVRGQYTTGVTSPATGTLWTITNANATFNNGQFRFTLFAPYVNDRTYISTNVALGEQGGGVVYHFMAGEHQVSDVYDSCEILFPSAQSGSISVYGYKE
jgi:hypothetical protein